MRRTGRVFIAMMLLGSACSRYGAADDAVPVPGLALDDAGDGGSASDSAADATEPDVGGGAADAADASPPPCNGSASCTRIVFVTSATFDGNLTGPDGADAKCTTIAAGSKHAEVNQRKFRAWLGTSLVTVRMRHVHGMAPYVRVDGAKVAIDWGGLTSGVLLAPLDRDENGVRITSGDLGAWTGTRASGAATGKDCQGWVLNGNESGSTGRINATGPAWTEDALPSCQSVHRLYCIEY